MCDVDLTHQERNFAIGRINITDGCKKSMLDVNVSIAIPEMYLQPITLSDVPLTIYSSQWSCKGRSPVFLETILPDVLDLARDQQI